MRPKYSCPPTLSPVNTLSKKPSFSLYVAPNFKPPCSVSGILKIPLALIKPLDPAPNATRPPNSRVGEVRRTFITPPVVFLPKKIPCGPRLTSICSTSKASINCPVLVPRTIPSIITPTGGFCVFSTS